jgi:uncharacterized protein YdeI (YjbR/CyaY-like superfamily)
MDEQIEHLTFSGRASWRSWLLEHHSESDSVWVLINKKRAPPPGLYYDEAVEEALCFGWIDSTLNPLDERCYRLRFGARRPDSLWSAANQERVAKLAEEGLMTEAGAAAVIEAKANGQWAAAIRREQVDVIPPDLESALSEHDGAVAGYLRVRASRRKQWLYWLQSARRPRTRARRIAAIVDEVVAQPKPADSV